MSERAHEPELAARLRGALERVHELAAELLEILELADPEPDPEPAPPFDEGQGA